MKTTSIIKWYGLWLLPFLLSLAASAKSPELVDLGLSVKWADMNIDAANMTDYGGYYAWGETATKPTYTWANYVYCNGTETTCQYLCDDISRNISYDRAYNSNPTMWLPTVEQWEELISKCTWRAVTINGVKGYNVTGPNGNSIFLPFSGRSYDGSKHEVGTLAYYWTANNYPSNASKAQAALIKNNSQVVTTMNRRTGAAIRAVGALDTIELVDLGLSVKWANKNIDADDEPDSGGYYAWGEIETKDTYTWANYEYCSGSDKTCFIIGSDIRKNKKYDRAYNYSTNLCLPTKAQWEELEEKCKWTAATKNGMKGYDVKGPSGNSIFLPFSGRSYDGSEREVGNLAYYWTANNYPSDVSKAQAALIKADIKAVTTMNRRTGAAIRAVEVTDKEGYGWYLVTNKNEFIKMSRVSLLVATDEEPCFSVIDNNGSILAYGVTNVRFELYTPITEIKTPQEKEGLVQHQYIVNKEIILVGSKGEVRIYNNSGMLIKKDFSNGYETHINVSFLPPGIYIVQCEAMSFKFVKK